MDLFQEALCRKVAPETQRIFNILCRMQSCQGKLFILQSFLMALTFLFVAELRAVPTLPLRRWAFGVGETPPLAQKQTTRPVEPI
jgi:hypothetical protein